MKAHEDSWDWDWDWSALGRIRGDLIHVHKQLWWKLKQMEAGAFQWCPVIGGEAAGTN